MYQRYYPLRYTYSLTTAKSYPVLDATRLATGQAVVLKIVYTHKHPQEVEITQHFSREPLASHPRNHCVPLLDVLTVPDKAKCVILVLPLLRKVTNPRFNTVGEAVEFVRQVLEACTLLRYCRYTPILIL